MRRLCSKRYKTDPFFITKKLILKMKLVSVILPLLSAEKPKRKGCDPSRLPNYKITKDCIRRRGHQTKPDENGVYLEKPGNYCKWQLQCEFDIENSITRPIACKCRRDGKTWFDGSVCGLGFLFHFLQFIKSDKNPY